jgi:hypothetical protein
MHYENYWILFVSFLQADSYLINTTITVVCDVTPYALVHMYNVLEGPAAPIFIQGAPELEYSPARER